MRLVMQRVTRGRVSVAGQTVGEIGRGLVVLVGVTHADTPAQAEWLAEKTAHLRIFEDAAGKMNRSVLDIGGSVLAVSQFTLYANAEKGRRPSFIEAAPPEHAEPLITHYVTALQQLGVPVQTGQFRADMLVEIDNAGPVTILLEK